MASLSDFRAISKIFPLMPKIMANPFCIIEKNNQCQNAINFALDSLNKGKRIQNIILINPILVNHNDLIKINSFGSKIYFLFKKKKFKKSEYEILRKIGIVVFIKENFEI